jgi:nitrous oxidase accessory protein NosD
MAVALAVSAPAASAHAFDVHPGANAIQDAIDSAHNGDTLRIHSGTYPESFSTDEAVNVDKKLTLVGVGNQRPVIDADCGARYGIEAAHDGVALKNLKVVGADSGFGAYPAEVDFTGRHTGRAQDLVVRNTCDAEYGINVNSDQGLKLIGNRGIGFDDSGIYIGDITNTGSRSVIARYNEMSGNNRGLIVEDSTQPTDIRILYNDFHDNDIPPGEGSPAGIFLHNSDGVLIQGNRTNHNGDGSEGYGIHLDPNSDDNHVLDNIAKHNDTKNLFDEGAGNCGSSNSFTIPVC